MCEGSQPIIALEMLDAAKLHMQEGLFKVTMKSNSNVACALSFDVNPLIKIWQNLSSSRHLCKLISKYMKLAETRCVLVLGLVENEKCLKSCQRNRFGKHLPLAMRMYGQKHFILDNFLYKHAI